MLTVAIPDEIEKQLSFITDDKEKFIIEVIKQRLVVQRKKSSTEELAKEYAETVAESKKIMEDFKYADDEQWDNY